MLHSIEKPNQPESFNVRKKRPARKAGDFFIRKLLIIAGLPIDNLTMDETLDRIEQFIKIGRTTGKTHQIATVNADFVVKAANDSELGYLIQSCDLATPDGMPLVWGSRILGVNVEERVAGSDMVPLLAERAAKKGYSLYLFGAAEGVAEKAKEILTAKYPNLKIVGAVSPPYSGVIDVPEDYIEDIKRADPDVLLVALGNPKQEKFIGMYGRDLKVPVAIGIGGTLDFIAGKTKRAPLWMQRLGIEWFHRMTNDPKRLIKRYVHDFYGFTTFFFGQWWRLKSGKNNEALLPKTDAVIFNNQAVLRLSGRIDLNYTDFLREQLEKLLKETNQIDIDLSEVTFIDSVSIGQILAFVKLCREDGGNVRLINMPDRIFTTFKYLKMDRFLDIYRLGTSTEEPKPLETIKRDSEIIIRMPKRLDAITKPETLEICLDQAKESHHLILDFSHTKLIASAGLALLVHLNEYLKTVNGSLKLANCPKDIRKTLEIVKFDILFPLIDLEISE